MLVTTKDVRLSFLSHHAIPEDEDRSSTSHMCDLRILAKSRGPAQVSRRPMKAVRFLACFSKCPSRLAIQRHLRKSEVFETTTLVRPNHR